MNWIWGEFSKASSKTTENFLYQNYTLATFWGGPVRIQHRQFYFMRLATVEIANFVWVFIKQSQKPIFGVIMSVPNIILCIYTLGKARREFHMQDSRNLSWVHTPSRNPSDYQISTASYKLSQSELVIDGNPFMQKTTWLVSFVFIYHFSWYNQTDKDLNW